MQYRASLLLAVVVVSAPGVGAQQPADLVLHNGKIAAVDDAFTILQAVVIRDGRIIAVGGNDIVKAYQAARTIDLNGRLAIPGFNDTHIHLGGQARRHVNLAGTRS